MSDRGRRGVLSALAAFVASITCAWLEPASSQRFTLKIASPTIDDVTHEWMKALKAGVEARAGNRIRIDIYPAGALGSVPATIEDVALGTLAAAVSPTTFLAGVDARYQVFDLPDLFVDLGHAQRVLTDPDAIKIWSAYGAGKGTEPLVILPQGPVMVVSQKPVRTVDDLMGLKMRVAAGTPLFVEMAKKLGASPVAMPLAEAPAALQANAIVASVAPLSVLGAMKFADAAKSVTQLPGAIVSVGVLTNVKFMKSLGRELERTVREEALKAAVGVAAKANDNATAAREAWTKGGSEVIDLPEPDVARYRQAVASVLPPVLANAPPALRTDHDKLLAVAKRLAP